MLNSIAHENIEMWFNAYVESFDHDDPACLQSIEMKKVHTQRVRENIRDIGTSQSLNSEELRLADIVALLHDVGRFEQAIRHKTFSDLKSEDHAKLGLRIIADHDILREVDERTKRIIHYAVSHHNCRLLKDNGDDDCMLFLKLLRDADKLDVWRFFREYFQGSIHDANHIIVHGLPDEPGYSDQVIEDVLAGKMAEAKELKNLNDLKLAHIGLIWDINFRRTYEIFCEKGYLESFIGYLPKCPEIDHVYRSVKSYVRKRLS